MYTDKDAMQSAVERIQALIKKGESFALTTTTVPIEKFDAVSKWNDDVVKLFMDLYCRSSLYGGKFKSKFDNELSRAANHGEQFAVLMQKLHEQFEEIKSGKDVLFRRLDFAGRCQMAIMGAK